MTVQALFHTHTYHAMLDALEGIVIDHDPADDGMLRTRLIETLGDVAGIWPVSCYTGEDAGPSIMVTA